MWDSMNKKCTVERWINCLSSLI